MIGQQKAAYQIENHTFFWSAHMLKNHRLNHLCIRSANTEARDSGFNLTNKGEMGLSVGDSKMASDPLTGKMERKTGNTRISK
jgi:hypothetical protein